MPKVHVVAEGECLASIAYENGFFHETLWNLEENAELRKLRGRPYVLHPGDRVFIPDKRTKQVACRTGAVHRFRRKGVPEQLRLRLEDKGEPRAGFPYLLIVDGREIEGETDDKGELGHGILPNAREAVLVLRPPHGREERYELSLRGLNPVSEVSGVQGRLRNLGFYKGPLNGEWTEEAQGALAAFQESAGLEATGRLDGAVRDALLKAHGS